MEKETFVIEDWGVREVLISGEKVEHLIGNVPDKGKVIVEIKDFDRNTMTFTTTEGRKYEAVTDPLYDDQMSFSDILWNSYISAQGAIDYQFIDTTRKYSFM